MRNALGNLLKPFIIPLLGWSALGMLIDVVSGPLTPEAALGAICEFLLASDATSAPDVVRGCPRDGADEAGVDIASEGDTLPSMPPMTVQHAAWTAPMIAPHSVLPLTFGLSGHPLAPDLMRLTVSATSEHRRSSGGGEIHLSVQLCRFHC